MKIGLNEQQFEFLRDRFNITKKDIDEMSKEGWNKVREDLWSIEVDELLDEEERSGDPDNCETEPFLLSSSIVDLPYLDERTASEGVDDDE